MLAGFFTLRSRLPCVSDFLGACFWAADLSLIVVMIGLLLWFGRFNRCPLLTVPFHTKPTETNLATHRRHR